jgi:hypothetical protein
MDIGKAHARHIGKGGTMSRREKRGQGKREENVCAARGRGRGQKIDELQEKVKKKGIGIGKKGGQVHCRVYQAAVVHQRSALLRSQLEQVTLGFMIACFPEGPLELW